MIKRLLAWFDRQLDDMILSAIDEVILGPTCEELYTRMNESLRQSQGQLEALQERCMHSGACEGHPAHAIERLAR